MRCSLGTFESSFLSGVGCDRLLSVSNLLSAWLLVLLLNVKVINTHKCYSCMSEVYGVQWNYGIEKTYRRPVNFTNHCNNDQSSANLQLVDCPSVCILMIEKVIVGGYENFGYIRGCFDTMLVNGFNESAVYSYRWLKRDICRWYDRRLILKLPVKTEGEIYVCACYGSRCNSAPSTKASLRTLKWHSAWLLSVVLTLQYACGRQMS